MGIESMGYKVDVETIKRKLEEEKNYIEKCFYVKKIGIFGSFVRSEQTPSSDIDVLVEFEKGHKDFFNYMKLKYYLENLLERKVDLVIKKAIKPKLKERILTEVEYI
jgi:predicted nucleotidyltransferase